MASPELLFRGARVVDPRGGRDEVADVHVREGLVVEVGQGLGSASAEIVECDGLVLAPGLVDMHTHLREPGFEQKETVETGTRAAAAGGYTAVAPMANTDPVADDASVIAEVRAAAARAGLADVFPVGAITKGLEGEVLAEIGEMVGLGGPRVQRRRPVRPDGTHAPERAHLRAGLRRRRDRGALRGRLPLHRSADARRDQLLLAGPRRAAGRRRGRDRLPRHRDGTTHRRPAAHLPPVVGAVRGPGATGEGRRAPRVGGGHAASPRLHRRGSPHLRHEPEGEPAAAVGGGPGRAPGRPGGRHDRRDRHGSRAPRRRGEGGRVRPSASRHDRPRDGARGRADGARGARVSCPCPGRWRLCRPSPRGSSAPATTAARSRRAGPPT